MICVHRGELRAVHHDGGGRYPRKTLYTGEPSDLVRAQSLDPGHAHGWYEWLVDGDANVYPDRASAIAAARRRGGR